MKAPIDDRMLMGRVDIMRGVTLHVISRTYRNYLAMRDMGAGKFESSDTEVNPFDRNNYAQWDVHMFTGYESFKSGGVMEVFFDRKGLAAFRNNYTVFCRKDLSEKKRKAICDDANLRIWMYDPPLFLPEQVTVENAWRLLRSGDWHDRLAGVGMASQIDNCMEAREMARWASRDWCAAVRRRVVDKMLRLDVPMDVYEYLFKYDPDMYIREEAAVQMCRLNGGLEAFMTTIAADMSPLTRATMLLLQDDYDNCHHVDHFVDDPDPLVRCAAVWTCPGPVMDSSMMLRIVKDDPVVFHYMSTRYHVNQSAYTWIMNEFMRNTKSEDIHAEAAMGLLGAWQ